MKGAQYSFSFVCVEAIFLYSRTEGVRYASKSEKMDGTGVVTLKRHRVTTLQFRSNVGKAAAEEAKINPESYLAIVANQHFHFAELSWEAFETDDDKKHYRDQRAEERRPRSSSSAGTSAPEAPAGHSTLQRSAICFVNITYMQPRMRSWRAPGRYRR